MTDRWGRGSTATLTAYFREGGSGVLIDAAPVLVDIIDPDDIVVVTDAAPTTNPSTGTYTYSYAIAAGAKLGVWTARWSGVVNDVPVSGEDPFEVVAAGEVGFDGDTFATVAQLAAYLDIELDEENERALLALRLATGTIQRECKHRIFLFTDDVKRLRGTVGGDLVLPEPPVLDVASVVDGEDAVAGTSLVFTRSGLLRGESYWSGQEMTVTYTHGFSPVPDDVVSLCLQVAARIYYAQPGGVDSESIGSYSYSASSNGGGIALSEDERRICRAFWPVNA